MGKPKMANVTESGVSGKGTATPSQPKREVVKLSSITENKPFRITFLERIIRGVKDGKGWIGLLCNTSQVIFVHEGNVAYKQLLAMNLFDRARAPELVFTAKKSKAGNTYISVSEVVQKRL